MADPVRLIVVRNPFDRRERDERQIAVSSAPTIEALVGEYLPAGAPDGTELAVAVNGERVPMAEWGSRIIRPGDEMVAMPVVHGGGGGILGSIASIALMVVAPYIGAAVAGSGWAATAIMGSSWLTAGIISAGVTMAVGLVGSAVIGSLLAPDKPQLPSRSLQSYDSSPSYGWNPTTTQEPGGVVNRAYGRVKLYGNIIAGYIENTGDTGREQVAHALVDLGMGPYSRLYDFRINQQDIANYRGVTLIERRGNLNQKVIGDFSDTRLTRSIGAKVVKGSPVTRTTVGSDFDALDIVLTLPQGLYYANDSGGLSNVDVKVRVEISEDSLTWLNLTYTGTNRSAVSGGRWSRGRMVQVKFGFIRWHDWSEVEAGSASPSAHTEGEIGADGTTWRWLSKTIEIATDPDDYITITAAQQQPIRRTIRANNLNRGKSYQVRVTNLTEDQTSNRYGDDLYLSEINEVLYDDFTYPRTVLVGIRALATDQLSGGLQFDCMGDTAIIRVWNGSAWVSEFSRNPAWICWDILTQPVLDNDLNVIRYDGLHPSRLILSDFYAWAQWCDAGVPGNSGMEPRCQWDGIFDTPTSCWEAALEVAASARATLLMRGTSVTVVWDRPRTLPAQVFSVGNTAVNSFREVFLPMQDRASAIEVDYVNAEQDHQRDKLTVVNAAVTEASAQRVQFSNRGIRRPSQAWREAMVKLKRNELLRRSGELGVDIDAIACTVGDMIWVQNDVTRWGEGGRIVSGTTTSLVLDKEITLETGKSYEVVLRLADDTIVTRAITTAAGTVSAVSVASAFPATPQPYDVYAIGESGRAIKPFIVTDIRRDGEQRATLSLIEYNASLYLVDSGAATVPTPDISMQPNVAITDLTLSEGMFRAADGSVVVYIDVNLSTTADCRAVRVMANGWAPEDVAAGYRRLSGAVSGETYTVRAAPIDGLGRLQPASTWREASITPVGKMAPPANVSWFSIRGKTLSWGAVPDIDLAGYLLRWVFGSVADWSRGQPLHDGLVTESPWTPPMMPTGQVVLMIKAVDTSGNESLDFASIFTNLGQPIVANIVDVFNLQASNFPGVIAGGAVSAGSLLANSTDSIWSPDDTAPMWSDDADAMWDLTYYAALTYVASITVGGTEAGAQMTIDYSMKGLGAALEYRHPTGDAAPFWSTDSAPMWTDDAAPFRTNAGGWLPWPGALAAQAGEYQFRIRTGFGRTRGRVDALAINLDVPDIVEYLDDINISAGGTRLPLTNTYRVIRNVNLTLQADGGSAAGIKVIDKSAALGPLVNCTTTAGSATSGRVDAIIKGY